MSLSDRTQAHQGAYRSILTGQDTREEVEVPPYPSFDAICNAGARAADNHPRDFDVDAPANVEPHRGAHDDLDALIDEPAEPQHDAAATSEDEALANPTARAESRSMYTGS
jgi:hypothetical protein